MRALVIFNPVAGWRRRRFLRRVLDELGRRGVRVTVRETRGRGDAERFAREASAAAFDRLVVAGGDGTINEAVNGLRDRALPVAIVPLGTANVLAAEIGLRIDAAAVAAAIASGPVRPVAMGRVNGRRFAMMAGIGFDAHVVEHVSLPLKRATGKLAYIAEMLSRMRAYRPTLYEVCIDGRVHRAASAIIAKGHFYGGRFVCAPAARLDSPDLHVCLFGRAGRVQIVRYAAALALGALHRLPDVTIVPARHVEVLGPAGEPVQGDGDTLARLPAAVDVLPDDLRLVMPA